MQCLAAMGGLWKSFFKTLKLFYVVLFFFLLSSVSGEDKEIEILMEFKNSISDPSGILSSWTTESSRYCSWYGITCNSDSRVVELKIPGGNGGNSSYSSCSKAFEFTLLGYGETHCSENVGKLVGKLSPVIGKLSHLRVLSLPFNELSGELPSEMWGLKNIEVLDLEGNLITGYLSGDIGNLRKLKFLNLGFNRISDEIPSSLSKCEELEALNLARNRLKGKLPGFLGNLLKLKALHLSFNQLVGNVPEELVKNCGDLQHMDLSGNYLNGNIPGSFGKCSKLRTLLFFSNAFDGVLPHELGDLQMLEVLDVSRNNLRGPIPAKLGNCIRLSVLVLSSHFDQRSFGLSNDPLHDYNVFEGSIPVEVTTLPELKIVWAPGANLSGKFPSNWGRCDGLEMVNLAQNFFSGEISGVFGGCKNLHFLNLTSNRISGNLDEKLRVPCMTVFDVSRNQMSGLIPSFFNNTCNSLPSYNYGTLLPFSPFFAYLSFFTCQTFLESPLPFLRFSLPTVHDFSCNNFNGAIPVLPVIPQRLGKQVDYAFLVNENNLTGPFHENLFGNCNELSGMSINISNNKLFGQIPSDIGAVCRSLKVLDASKNQISGPIPQSLGDLHSLIMLDLSWNKLQGQVPVNLRHMKNLKYLALAGNRLTGTIPEMFSKLPSLQCLELPSNFFSGDIPQSLVSLRNLAILLLSNDSPSGEIPSGLADMTSLTKCNVSFSNLSGQFLWGGKKMNCNSFLRNPFLPISVSSLSVPPSGFEQQDSVASPSASSSEKESKGFNPTEVASIISATVIVGILLGLVILFFYIRRKSPNSRAHVSESSERKEIVVFKDIGVPLTFETIVEATGNFSGSQCIGYGGFGATYKAEVAPGIILAVKRLTVERCQGVPQFDAEIGILGRLQHSKLITLIGYHASQADMFLIYNFLPGGNLEQFIQERSGRPVNWKVLHKISLDIASALAYLHDQCSPRVLHRDIKPSNILLDDEFNAYLSDFGLSRLLGTSETHATTSVAGTFGYVAPEYALTCRVSEKADVYSYGVVLLELLSDKKALDPSFSPHANGFNIVSWASMLLGNGQVKEIFTAGLWDAAPQNHLVEILRLAILCTDDIRSIRPAMKQVVRELRRFQPP